MFPLKQSYFHDCFLFDSVHTVVLERAIVIKNYISVVALHLIDLKI